MSPSGTSQRSGTLRWIWIAATWVGVVCLCGWLFGSLDLGGVAAALGRASWPFIAAAAFVNLFVNTLAKARRWHVLLDPLRPSRRPGLIALGAVLLASMAWNNLLPARAGDAVRAAQAHRRYGYPVGGVVAVQLFEKVVEALSLVLFALVLVIVSDTPPALAAPVGGFLAIGAGGVALILLGAWYGRRTSSAAEPVGGVGRLKRFLGRMGEAMSLLNAPAVWLRSFGWSCVCDLIELVLVALCLWGVGITPDPLICIAVLLAVNLAIAVPSTPGHLGVLEGAVVLVLSLLGVDRESALAFALLYHAAHVLPVTVAGLAVSRFRLGVVR